MSDPFRLRVLKAVTAQIKTVTPGNGYTFNLADYTDAAGRTMPRVFRGRRHFSDSDPIPMVSILELPANIAPQENPRGAGPVRKNQMRLVIEGFVPDDMNNPLDPAYHLGAAVIAQLVKAKTGANVYNILGLGGKMPCVGEMEIGAATPLVPEQNDSTVASFVRNLTLSLVENIETPFA